MHRCEFCKFLLFVASKRRVLQRFAEGTLRPYLSSALGTGDEQE
jgi:hypothetical protein